MKTSKRVPLITTFLALMLGSATALAMPLTGSITFGGLFTPTGGTGLGDATGLDVSLSVVLAAEGDFAPTTGQFVTWEPLQFSPPDLPVVPLWSVSSPGGTEFAFDLEEVVVQLQSDTALLLDGTGTLRADGFDDTFGTWSFSGNGVDVLLTFSANNRVALTEPTSAFLLLAGVAAITLRQRARRA
ncbi:MAG: hypothetical protein AAFX85_05855 [Pseudomonadota bacterium]